MEESVRDDSCVDSYSVRLSNSVFLKYRAEVVGDRWEKRNANSVSGKTFSPF